MGCCASRDDGGCCGEDKPDEPLASIERDRSCTDILFLVLYFMWWGAVIALISVSYDKGADLERLQYRTDWKGDLCGGPNNEGKEVAMWILPLPQFAELFMCLESCDDVRNPWYLQEEFNYNATRFMNLCVPTATIISEILGATGATEEFANGVADIQTAIPLLGAAVILAFVLSFLYTYFLRLFAKFMVWLAVILIFVGAVGGAAVLFQRAQAMEEAGTQTQENIDTIKALSSVFLIISVVFLLIVIALRKRIAIAIEVIKEASRAIVDVKSVVFFPIVTMGVGVGYVAFWIFAALVMFSVKDESQEEVSVIYHAPLAAAFLAQDMTPPVNVSVSLDFPSVDDILEDPDSFNLTDFASLDTVNFTYPEFSFSDEMQQPFAVHFFHLLWNVQFLIYFTYAVIAGAIADWYFTPRDERGHKIVGSGDNELTRTPVLSSAKRVLRYHLGTIAFGSFIIAVIQFIRAVVKYIEEQTKEKGNVLTKAIFCCVQCCLWCLQKCLDRVSKNAIIWNAIYGTNFCRSSLSSFHLLLQNVLRVAALNGVAGYLLVIGKVAIPVLNTGVFGAVIVYLAPYNETIGSPLLPLCVVFISSYLVAALFLEVYEGTIDTVFLCFLVDDKENGKGEMMASPGLQKIVNKYQKSVGNKKAKKRASKGQTAADDAGEGEGVEIQISPDGARSDDPQAGSGGHSRRPTPENSDQILVNHSRSVSKSGASVQAS